MIYRGPHPSPGWSALSVLIACEAAAMAVWLLPASIRIVQWPPAGPVRLALLAPAWQLVALLVAGFVVAAGLVGNGVGRRRGGATWTSGPPAPLKAVAQQTAPLLWLLLWAVPYLPAVPDRWPLLLVFAGPLRWFVVAAIAAYYTRHAAMRAARAVVTHAGRREVFTASLAIYLVLGLYTASQVGVGGDEPHYLIITESLIRDGDLKIENNHRQRDYRGFFSGELRPDFFERGKNGEIYSIHAPGLPALSVPAYWLGGRVGVVAFIAFTAALTALAVFDLAAGVAGTSAAWLTWLATCLTVPFLPYAWLIFPEMPGALLVAWGALWLWQPRERPASSWALRGAALAVLPWLHTKFIVFLAIFSLGFALKLLRHPRRLVALGVPIALSTAAWLYSFYAIYGSVNPEAPYGVYSRVYVLTRYIPHGLIGILFDQKFGLLFYSPIYAAAAWGAFLLWRAHPRLALVVLVAAGAFVGSTARLYMFWGGSSAPARFLVPVLPCLAPMLAMAFERVRAVGVRALLHIALAVSLVCAAIGVLRPDRQMLFSDPHGRARILEWLQDASPLPLVVPTFTEPTWAVELPPLGWWLLVVAVSSVAAMFAGRRSGRTSTAVGVFFAVAVLGSAVVTAQVSDRVRAATARRGAIDTLTRFDGDRYRTLWYDTMHRASVDEILAATLIPLDVVPRAAGSTVVTLPVSVPPGTYEAVVWFTGTSPEGEVLVTDSPRAVLGRVAGPLGSPLRIPVVVPMTARRLTVNVPDEALAHRVQAVVLAPRAIVPPLLREPLPVRAMESLPFAEAFLGYTDEHAYPEGGVFWTRGTARTEVVVAPGGASRMTLVLSTGPQRGIVDVWLDGEHRQIAMPGQQEQIVTFPLAGKRLVSLGVQSSVMFRPSEVDPSSTDGRGLGCQVRLSLE